MYVLHRLEHSCFSKHYSSLDVGGVYSTTCTCFRISKLKKCGIYCVKLKVSESMPALYLIRCFIVFVHIKVVQAWMNTCPCPLFSSLIPWHAVFDCGLEEQTRHCHFTRLNADKLCCGPRESCVHTHTQTHKQGQQPKGALYEGISVNIQWQSRCWWPCEVEAELRAWCWLISTTNIQERSELVIPVKTPAATHSPGAILLLQHTEEIDSGRGSEKCTYVKKGPLVVGQIMTVETKVAGCHKKRSGWMVRHTNISLWPSLFTSCLLPRAHMVFLGGAFY